MRVNRLFTSMLVANVALCAVPLNYANEADRTVKVATYNMYPGTEFSGIFFSQSGEELVAEVGEAYSDVNASNVAERIDEIADQIATNGPHLVGLQEVALWRVGDAFDPAPAETVAYDFLQMLLDELAERGANYAAISVQTNLDAELPGAGATFFLDIRYTDRVVILARTDLQTSEIKVESVAAGTFDALLTFGSPVLGTVQVPRGWTSADIKHRGKTYRFYNAHLESFVAEYQWAQAAEVVEDLANTGLPVILAGDFNSPAPGGVSYGILLSGGFADAWTATNAGSTGFTWPLSGEHPSDLLDPNERIDLVLYRGAITAKSTDLLGEEEGDITPSGFRPSDHAGVAASFVLHP